MKENVRLVGQRFMVGFEGHAASADVKRMLRDYGVASVILFARNVDSPEQVAELVRELQEEARSAGHDQPLLVAVDQEGGRVARLKAPWTVWPPLRALGRAGEPSLARRMGVALADELKACGIRLDFAPVVDVDTNPKNPIIGDRSFGDDPELVGKQAAAFIEGLQGGGVAACAKHFPGHGDTDVDSHLDLPVVDHSLSRLRDVELRPFRHAIEAGVATVMTAHVLVRELDDQLPATLSPRILGRLLRGELAFDGVIVSDDLEMKALASHWPFAESAVLAAEAGCDLLPVCKDHDAQVRAMEGLIRAVETERISWKAHEQAAGRVRRVKERFGLPHLDPDPKQARHAAGVSWALAQEIADRGGMHA